MEENSFINLVKDNNLIKEISIIVNNLDKSFFISEEDAYKNPDRLNIVENKIKKSIEENMFLKNINYKIKEDYSSYIDKEFYKINYVIINNSDSKEELSSTTKLSFSIHQEGSDFFLEINDIDYNKKLIAQDISIEYELRNNMYHAHFTCEKSKMRINFQYCEKMFFSDIKYSEDEYSEFSHKLDYTDLNIKQNEFYNPYFEKLINLSNLTEGNEAELGEELVLLLKDLMFAGKKIETDIIESYQLLKDIDLSEFSFLSVDKSINQTLAKKNRLK